MVNFLSLAVGAVLARLKLLLICFVIGVGPSVFGQMAQKASGEDVFNPVNLSAILIQIVSSTVISLLIILSFKQKSSSISLSKTVSLGRAVIFRYLGYSFVVLLLTIMGFYIFVLPGFIIMFCLIFWAPLVLLDGQNLSEACRKSVNLVKTNLGLVTLFFVVFEGPLVVGQMALQLMVFTLNEAGLYITGALSTLIDLLLVTVGVVFYLQIKQRADLQQQ